MNSEDEIISEALWKRYVRDMHPARELTGENLALLKKELENDFLVDPDDPDDDDYEVDDPYDTQANNMLKFAKQVGGMYWLNAVHQFKDLDAESDYSENSKDKLDEESRKILQEQKAQFGGKYTPLTYVLENEPENWRMVRLLVAYGSDVNLPDAFGRPPLWWAVFGVGPFGPRWQTVNILLENGANGLATYRGKSVVELAKELAKGSGAERPRQMIWETLQEKYNLFDPEDASEDES